MEEVVKKRGRPLKEGARRKQYRLLMTEKEFDELTVLSKLTNKSKSDYIRESLRMMKNLVEATTDTFDNDDFTEEYYEEYPDDDYDFE